MTDEAKAELRNWGLCNHDGWLSNHALYSTPPTSDQYVPAAGEVWDEPERGEPIDFDAAALTESLVVSMGLEGAVGFERYRVLVYYYTRLAVCHLPHDGTPLTREQCIKRLSKHMHTSFSGAERMLKEAIARYWEKRCSVAARKRRA